MILIINPRAPSATYMYIYVLFTIIINGSAFKSIQTCKHNYVIYTNITMQITNNNKLQ